MRVRTCLALSLFMVMGGAGSFTLRPVLRERIAIRSIPVALQASDPSRDRVGVLTLLAGWKLESRSSQFGGWSALDVVRVGEGWRVTMLSDAGALLRFGLGRFGNASDAEIVPLPPGCGDGNDKRARDTESLVHSAASGPWLIGYEWRNGVCTVDNDFTKGMFATVPAMRGWAKAAGPESMVRLPDGRVVIIAEGGSGGTRSVLIFAPGAGWLQPPGEARYTPPAGTSPSDAALLPDGRIVIVNRRFTPFDLFTTVLTTIDARDVAPGARLVGKPIARFESPLLSDNFEGLSVTVEGGKPILWMVSDNNFMSWQGNYLLKFAIDAPR